MKFKVLLLLVLLSSLLYAERYALVIGNSSYINAPLKNPVNDAIDVSNSLETYGYRVTTLLDANEKEMIIGIKEFVNKLNSDSEALFYYAGHGIQSQNINYMIPIGAEITNEDDLEFEAVEVDRVLRNMESSNSKTNIIILDACRNNPYSATSRSLTRGLTVVESNSTGSLIMFATSPGDIAEDGEGRNGVFTTSLLKFMGNSELEIHELIRKVRKDVMFQTNNKQTPYTSSDTLLDEFYINNTSYSISKEDSNDLGSDIIMANKLGSLQITSDSLCELFKDGKFIGIIKESEIINIKNLEVGYHRLELKFDTYTEIKDVLINENKVTVLPLTNKDKIVIEKKSNQIENKILTVAKPKESKRKLSFGERISLNFNIAHIEYDADGTYSRNNGITLHESYTTANFGIDYYFGKFLSLGCFINNVTTVETYEDYTAYNNEGEDKSTFPSFGISGIFGDKAKSFALGVDISIVPAIKLMYKGFEIGIGLSSMNGYEPSGFQFGYSYSFRNKIDY